MADDDSTDLEIRTLRLAQDMSGGATIVVDTDLVIVSATGPDLERAGLDPGSLTGQRLDGILDPQQSPLVLGAYRSALRGTGAHVEFVDEASGRLFDVEVRPLRGADDAIIGAVARAADLSEARAQQAHLAHVAAVQGLGVSTYSVRSGWAHDARALELLGMDAGLDPAELVDGVIAPDDRAGVRAQWAWLAAHGGRKVLSYRVTGGGLAGPVGDEDVRRIQSTVEVDLGVGGRVLRAVATHVDVSAAAAASTALERAARKAEADRIGLVRDLSAVVSQSPLTLGEIAKTVTDLAVAVLGGSAFFAELSADGTHFERVATSHGDPGSAGGLVSLSSDPLTRPGPDDSVLRSVLASGETWMSLEHHSRPEASDSFGGPGQHRIVVPVREQTEVVGVLALLREPDDQPYQPSDLDLAHIMAGHLGGALVAERALSGERRERARREAATLLLDDARTQRHSLVELLSEAESRERVLLAEAVHDEPIQLIAAARLRLLALNRRISRADPSEDGTLERTVVEESGRVGDILESALDRLRMLIVALTPPDLSDGLMHALSELAEATFRGTGTTVLTCGPATLSLTPAQQSAAMRILQEALVNARHHAKAARVVIRAGHDETHTVISVEDDGVGGSGVGVRKGHLGMMAMRARADDAGAELVVTSAPGAGTSVELRFPRDVGAP